MKPCMCNTLFLLGDTCTFNIEILVHLKCLKQVILPHFERFFDFTCKFEVHLCYLSKNKRFWMHLYGFPSSQKWAYNLV